MFAHSCLRVVVTCAIASATASFFCPSGAHADIKDNLDLPYDAVGVDVDDDDIPEVVTFYNQALEGDAFFFIIDRSMTMQNRGELDRAKREVIKCLDKLSKHVEFGVFFFDSGLIQFPGRGAPAVADEAMKLSAKAFVSSVTGGAGTCGQAGLSAALRMANQAASRRKVIVYLSDGGGTCAGNEEAQYLESTLAMVAAQNFQRVQINTIGVIEVGQIQESFLKRLAAMNGGTYTFVPR